MAAALLAVFGVVASVGKKGTTVVPLALGAASAAAMLLLKSKIEGDVARQAGGLVGCDFRGGFWMAFALVGIGAVCNALPLLLASGRVKSAATLPGG